MACRQLSYHASGTLLGPGEDNVGGEKRDSVHNRNLQYLHLSRLSRSRGEPRYGIDL